MNEKIGEHAGIIWRFLDRNGEITYSALVQGTKLNQKQVDRAMGWLSREGKVSIKKASNRELISLAE